MNHEEAYELIESYVFGTLDPDENDRVEVHLESGCEACLERLRSVSELSARLASTVPQAEPSPQIKKRILEEIRSGQQPARERRRMPLFGWIPAVAGAAAAIVLLVWTMNLNKQLDVIRTELSTSQNQITRLEGEMAAYADAALLLGKPCTKIGGLDGVDPNPEAFGQVLMHPEEEFGVFYVYRMPEPPQGMEYQLWMLRDGVPTSVGVFTVLADGTAILKMDALPDPTSIEEFAVTIEPSGGRPEPTGMLYLTGPNPLSGGSMH